jgi:hypothetical protein
MFTIGDFARNGRVSVRMLRHYDATGLLRPARVDPATDLPGAGNAATIVHRGSMDNVMPAWQALARWIDANGYRSSGYPRELYLECPDDPDLWVTELQEPITSS